MGGQSLRVTEIGKSAKEAFEKVVASHKRVYMFFYLKPIRILDISIRFLSHYPPFIIFFTPLML